MANDLPRSTALNDAQSKTGRDKRRSSRTATPTVGNIADLDEIKFECLKNAFYHEDREQHFSRLHKVIMFFVAVSGTAAVGTIASTGSWIDPLVLALGTTLASVADLVFDPSGKAKVHATLRQRFLDLNADWQAGEIESSKAISRVTRLYSEEPTNYRIVNCVAYNSAMRSLGRQSAHFLKVSSHHYFLRHWLPHPAFDPPTVSEHERRSP